LNRWLQRFRKCPGLSYRTLNRENKGVIEEEIGDLQDMSAFSSLLSEYNPKDIFNAHRCALFFILLPDKTYAFKDERKLSCGHEESRENSCASMCKY
jgi:hypothetical protein